MGLPYKAADEPVEAVTLTSRDIVEIQGRVRRAVSWICPDWLRHVEEDLAQQAMLRVVSQLQASGGNRVLNATYIKRTAHSVIMDEIRKRRSRAPVTADPESVERVSDDAPRPDRMVLSGEVGRAIRDCLDQAIESRRRAVTLYLLGHTVPQTGELLGFDAKKAENLVYRGLADLRECLSGKGVTP